MKNKISILFLLTAFSVSTYAQKTVKVEEKNGKIDETSGTVLSTTINRASEKTILKEWKSKMKDYDADVDTKKNRVTAKEVKIESIGTVGLEVLAEVKEQSDSEKEFTVMFIKNGQAITSSTEIAAFAAAKSIVREFAINISKEATEDFQKVQLKLFEDLEDDTRDAKKEEERAKEDIEDAKRKIKEAEETIKEKSKFLEDNKQTQLELSKKLSGQKTKVDAANKEMDIYK
jgi:hypothetical protein